jgi:peptidoglycan/LPS O-acetylase OafA/YrhL
MTPPLDIKPLTSLRFFAAFWVVTYHYWPKLAVTGTPALVAKGYLGVELFFILSGFILCHVYLPSFEAQRFRYGEFLWARLARIYPMHLATLVGIGLMGGAALAAGFPVEHNLLSLAALPANLALVHAWGFAPVVGWNHPSWSISAEWFAYLAFPLFAVAAPAAATGGRRRARPSGRAVRRLRFAGRLFLDQGDHRLGRFADRSVFRLRLRPLSGLARACARSSHGGDRRLVFRRRSGPCRPVGGP